MSKKQLYKGIIYIIIGIILISSIISSYIILTTKYIQSDCFILNKHINNDKITWEIYDIYYIKKANIYCEKNCKKYLDYNQHQEYECVYNKFNNSYKWGNIYILKIILTYLIFFILLFSSGLTYLGIKKLNDYRKSRNNTENLSINMEEITTE